MFCIAPSINLAGITLGVGFNFPMTAERWNPDAGGEKYYIDKELLKPMVMDLRLGGMINVWSTAVGKLFIELSGKYHFSGMYNEDSYIYGLPVDPRGEMNAQTRKSLVALDMTPASAQIGISYLFNLGL